jgi:DNA polymerase-3 subunit delta'
MLFSAISGHTELKSTLIKNMNNGRIAHSLLFAGPEGCGSLALALAYARYLRCDAPVNNDSCGRCSSCIKMNKLVHPDVHLSFPMIKEDSKKKGISQELVSEFRAAFLSNPFMNLDFWSDWIDAGNKSPTIYSEEASEIIREIGLVSVEKGFKVFIIWLPELMNVQAANRLLKTLEEPTEQTVIILVSEHPESLLATIRSRVQVFRIRAYTPQECAHIVSGLSHKTAQECLMAAEIAEGNVALANWLVQNQEESSEQLELFRGWMLDCYSFNITGLINRSEAFHKKGREWQKGFLSYCLFMFRQTLLYNSAPELLRLGENEAAFLGKFARFFHAENYEQISGFVNDAILHIERNGNGRIVFFDTGLHIADLFRKEKQSVAASP